MLPFYQNLPFFSIILAMLASIASPLFRKNHMAYRLTVAWTWDEESAGTSGTDSHAGQSGTAALSVCTADGTELFGLEIRRHFPHTLAEPEEDT